MRPFELAASVLEATVQRLIKWLFALEDEVLNGLWAEKKREPNYKGIGKLFQ